ncbi:hypothetical protein thsrh120_56590 [Rhizobium sp. No.120]
MGLKAARHVGIDGTDKASMEATRRLARRAIKACIKLWHAALEIEYAGADATGANADRAIYQSSRMASFPRGPSDSAW